MVRLGCTVVQLGVVSSTCSSATASLFSGSAWVCILLGHAYLQPFSGIYPLGSACSSSSVQLGPLSQLGTACVHLCPPPVQLGSTSVLRVLAYVQPGLASVQLGLPSHLCSEVQLGLPYHLCAVGHTGVQLGILSRLGPCLPCTVVRLGLHSLFQLGLQSPPCTGVHLCSVVQLGQPHLCVGGHSGVQLGIHSRLGPCLPRAVVRLGWHSLVQLGLQSSLVRWWLIWVMLYELMER